MAAIALTLSLGSVACSRNQSADATTNAQPDIWSGKAPAAQPLRDGERFQIVGMPSPYAPKAPNGGTDVYRCFLIDPKLTERVYITGSQFVPTNAEIVHHAIVFRVEPADVASAQKLDADDPGDGWTCFSGTGIRGRSLGAQLGAGAAWVGAWAPGGTETLLNARTGFRMEPGSQIILQIHYNLLATDGAPAGADQSGLRLRLADGSANLAPLQTTLLPGSVELPCAPGEKGALCDRDNALVDVGNRFGPQAVAAVVGLNALCNASKPPAAGNTQHCDHKVRKAGTIYAVGGHMHLLGRSITVVLNPGTPKAQTLLNVQTFNFDDQSARVLATPVAVTPGDTYRVTCTHDATLRRKLPELAPLPPRYVVWGEGTSDEMCLGIVIWA